MACSLIEHRSLGAVPPISNTNLKSIGSLKARQTKTAARDDVAHALCGFPLLVQFQEPR
jgi:hypothetical protein